ncbi:hypothetical protein MC885_016451 [Smutsia gigantea]|nr:hypothetical protein MC885_016451 [Smutsia gigantea]
MSSLIRKVISTAKAPAAIGPYRTIYISGQLGMDPSNGQLVPGGVAEEAKQALTNMGEILKAAGCDFTNVVKTTVLLADINDFNTVNEIYKQEAMWRLKQWPSKDLSKQHHYNLTMNEVFTLTAYKKRRKIGVNK